MVDHRATDPVKGLIVHEQREQVTSALRKIGPHYEQVLRLFYFDGLKYADIGERLGIPLGTVKSRMHQGTLKLRDLITDVGP